MKFCGEIAFMVDEEEVAPGIWEPKLIIRPYIGDILRYTKRNNIGDKQNINITISNQISILSDLFMQQNYSTIRYIVWNGVKWSVSSIDINHPRITFELGGVYNENEDRASRNIM